MPTASICGSSVASTFLRNKVFDRLTVPDRMTISWGDDSEIDLDLTVGGRWKVVRWEDGVEYLATGEFLEVQRPARLKYTFGMPQFSPSSDPLLRQPLLRITDEVRRRSCF